jgi:hypothetical protein
LIVARLHQHTNTKVDLGPDRIIRASRNVALDVVGREKVLRDKEGKIARLIEGGLTASDEVIFDELAIEEPSKLS